MTKEEILRLDEPFIFTELKRMGLLVKKEDLNQLLIEGKLRDKKIGRMNVYWKEFSESTETTGNESLIKQLELELEELKRELMAERQKVRKLSIQNGIDEPWKEIAMSMARILSEQKQVPMREVLEYFNAPLDDY